MEFQKLMLNLKIKRLVEELMIRRRHVYLVLIFFVFIILFSACNSRRRKRKKCDCPTWSYVIDYQNATLSGTL